MIRDELICPKSCAAHGEMNERVGEEEEEVLLLLFNYRSVTHVILFYVDASPAATSLNTLNTERRRRQSVWHANKKR